MATGWRTACVCVVGLVFSCGGAAAQETQVVPSPLKHRIAAFVAEHPQATLAEVAAFANRLLPELGLAYEFDDFATDTGAVRLQGERRAFVADYGEEDDTTRGPCGEWFVPLPALRVTKEWIDLVQEGRAWRVTRPETLRLDAMTIMTPDRSEVTATIEVPWQSTPAGATADGRGVIVRQYLWEEAEAVAAWWSQLRTKDPAVADSYPFLPLIVTEADVRYADDPALLHEPASKGAEVVESSENAYLRQQEFIAPNFVVEYSEPCT
jgi:hypothetical protein